MDNITGNILIVDDEENIRGGLRDVLEKSGHSIREAANGEEALRQLERFDCDVAIVDIQMPQMSGIELLQAIHQLDRPLAVIILTGNGSLQTAMEAVRLGANDYLLKPAAPQKIRETIHSALLTARRKRIQMNLIHTLQGNLSELRQLEGSPPPRGVAPASPFPGQIVAGDLNIDRTAHIVLRGETLIALTPSEFKLLVVLASHPGESLDYRKLVSEALGYTIPSSEARKLVKRHIFSLRQKLEPDPAYPRYVINVRGIGYRLKG